MDIFSHGLWVAVVYAKAKSEARWMAVFFGVAPDIFSFGILFVLNLFNSGSFGSPQALVVPAYILTLYNIWHSLFTWLAIFVIVWLIRRKPWWPLAAAFLHIAIDVPLHEADFFPTPWLWPFSNYTVDGYAWGHSSFLLSNYAVLGVVYIIWYIWDYRKRQAAKLAASK
ncbi:MAG: hypothetical protein ABIJ81_01540 [Patescibacteria group bacterium]